MPIELPTTPTFADIPLPETPTINIPGVPVISISEPHLKDPTGHLRAYSYEKYAAVINTLVDDDIHNLINWTGDDDLVNAQGEKVIDQQADAVRSETVKILDSAGSKGFLLSPGRTLNMVMKVEQAGRTAMQEGVVTVQGEISQAAIQFIQWAFKAGEGQVKIASDNNKRMVYANFAAVEEIANTLVQYQEKHTELYKQKIREYEAKIKNIDSQMLNSEAILMDFNAKVSKARQDLMKQDTELDERNARNLAVTIENAEVLLQAEECMNDAELERQKVLETQAALNGYLADIKLVHSELVQNRAEVDMVRADAEMYRKKAQLSQQYATAQLDKIRQAQQILDMNYKVAMSEVKNAEAEIKWYDVSTIWMEDYRDLQLESYRAWLRSTEMLYENNDLSYLSWNDVAQLNWEGYTDAEYTRGDVMAQVERQTAQISSDAWNTAEIYSYKGQVATSRARWQAEANTELTLLQTIK